MFSSFITIGTLDNLSVKYDNLYFIDKTFYYFTNDPSTRLPYVNKFTNNYLWAPVVRYFSTEHDITNYLEGYKFKKVELAALSDNLWYGNMGHALWDGFYPIYVSLTKFGYAARSFTYLTSDFTNTKTLAYEPIIKFCKGGLMEYPKLDEPIHFKELVAGTGIVGNRVMTSDYTLFGEKEYKALTLFKNRMMDVYGIKIDLPINSRLKAIIIRNKRYTTYELEVIKEVVEHFKDELHIKFIDWYHDYKTFGEQLLELQDVDIHITGPGTGMMYIPFLKKGGVNVNLGYIEHIQTNTSRPNLFISNTTVPDFLVPGYMEQAVCAGANYVSTLYYDRYEYNNLEFEPLVNLIKEAILVANKTKVVESNHFVDAKIYIEYCKRCSNPEEVVSYLTGIAFFIELFVNEHPIAINPEVIDIQLLRTIKRQFNFNNKYQIIPSTTKCSK